MLLLTTTGRRTGRPHRVSLTYLPHPSGFAVIGSNGGAPQHPDWVLNLRHSPQAIVQIRSRRVAVRAREAAGEERQRLWERAVAAYRGYEGYRRRTRRTIRLVVLEPDPSSSPLYNRD